MKKLLLGLGSIAAIAAPIAVVVSCSDDVTPKTPVSPQATPKGTIIADLTTKAGLKMKATMEGTKLFDALTKASITMPAFPATLPQDYTFEGMKNGKKVVLFEHYWLGESVHLRKIDGIELSQSKTDKVYDDPRNLDFEIIMAALQENTEFFSIS